MRKTYRFLFPFKGQVKTQLIISKNRLVKPKNVRHFENAVRLHLEQAFPLNQRPIEGYLMFRMVHYTKYKRNKEGLIEPVKISDLDNLIKTIQDCFQPIYGRFTKVDDKGQPVLTKKGNLSYEKAIITPGVIKDDKYIMRAGMYWIPVETDAEERIEIFLSNVSEEELFKPPVFADEEIIDLSQS